MSAFSQLPNSVRLPFAYGEFSGAAAAEDSGIMPGAILLVGQMLPGGEAEPHTVLRPTSAAQGEKLFGRGSMLAQMVAACLKANIYTKMLALGVPDFAGGAKARGRLEFAGEVSSAAPLCLYIGGQLVRLGLAQGQSAAEAATALADIINGAGNFSVTALAEGEAVSLTARHAGECGNLIDLRLNHKGESGPGGLSVSIGPMAGGAGNPEPTEAIAAMAGDAYRYIAWPWLDKNSLDSLKAELDDRFGPLRQQDGNAFVVKPGAFAEVTTFSAARNDKGLTVIPSENSPTLPWVFCAAAVGIVAYYGNNDPARPFQTLTIPGVLAPAPADRWSDFPERNQALFEGCSTIAVNDSGEVMFTNLITTHRINEWGAETTVFLSLNTLLTLSYLRWDWNNFLKQKYPRHKLADDEASQYLAPGQPVMTPKLGRAEAIGRFKTWLRRGLVEAPSQFAADIVVVRNEVNRDRLDWLMTPDLMNQFKVAGALFSHLV